MAERKTRSRKRRKQRIENRNLSYTQRQRIGLDRVVSAKQYKRMMSDIRKMNADINRATRYKNPIFDSHYEKRTYWIGGTKVTKGIFVQSPLEREFRSAQAVYNKFSREEEEKSTKSQGRVTKARVLELYQQEGEKRTREYLQHMWAKGKGLAFEYNSQDLITALDMTFATYDLIADNYMLSIMYIVREHVHAVLREGVEWSVKDTVANYVYHHFKAENAKGTGISDYTKLLEECKDYVITTLVPAHKR